MTSADVYQAPAQRDRAAWRDRQDRGYREQAWRRRRGATQIRMFATPSAPRRTIPTSVLTIDMHHPMPDVIVIYVDPKDEREQKLTAIEALIATLTSSNRVLVVNVQGTRLLCSINLEGVPEKERARYLTQLEGWIKTEVNKYNP